MPKRTKGRKRTYRRRFNKVGTETARVGCGVPNIQAIPKPEWPLERKPTDIETTARRVNELTNSIQETRHRIAYVESDLKAERVNLTRLMLEHADAVTKMRELAQIPQPVV